MPNIGLFFMICLVWSSGMAVEKGISHGIASVETFPLLQPCGTEGGCSDARESEQSRRTLFFQVQRNRDVEESDFSHVSTCFEAGVIVHAG